MSDIAQILPFRSSDDEAEELQSNAVPTGLGAITCIVLGILAACVAAVISGIRPFHALEPTFAGIVWAVPFLSGYVLGGIGRGKLLSATSCFLWFVAATYAFVQLSDFNWSDSLLLSISIATVGFIGGRYASLNWSVPHRRSRSASQESSEAFSQHATSSVTFSIWDLGFVSLVVAVAVSCVGEIQAPYALAACIFFAAIGGVVCSTVAARLALHDHWPLRHFAFLFALAIGMLALVLVKWPLPFDITLSWLISGPVNAITAQALTVLVCCAAYRWDRDRQSRSSALRPAAVQ